MTDTPPMKDIVNSVVKDIFDKNKSKEADLVGIWDEVVKKTLKKKKGNFGSLIGFDNKILKIKVANSSYFYKLTILKTALIDSINKKVGKVIIKDIKLSI